MAMKYDKAVAYGLRKLFGCHITTHYHALFTLFGLKRTQARNAMMMVKTFKKIQKDPMLSSLALEQFKLIKDSNYEEQFKIKRRKIKNRNTLGFVRTHRRTFYTVEIRKVMQIYNLKDSFTYRQAQAVIEDFHCRRAVINLLIEPLNWIKYIFDIKLLQDRLMRANTSYIRIINEYTQ
eukprot:420918_1